jgi:diguanylate cyclase
MKIDWSARSRARIYLFTVLGTAICIAVAFAFDSYSFVRGTWQWGADPLNNLIIPLLLAPPFFIFLLSQMRQLAIAHHELLSIATTDSLTALLNRRAFTETVDRHLARAQDAAAPTPGGLLVIDVDHFKMVNDNYGHDVGDEALKLVAASIRSAVRDTDLVGRMGGEEFCVFIPGLPPEHIRVLADRIRLAVSEAIFAPNSHRHYLAVSVGGVTFDHASTFSELYRGADQRLYRAKRMGRNRVDLTTHAANAPIQQTMH